MTTSQVRRVNVITRQRLLSDDFNNTGRMYGRSQALHSLAAGLGDGYLDGGLGKGGVIGGLLVECIPGTNRVRVSPGLALVESTPTSPTFDPPVAVIEQMVEAEIDLTAHIDPGSPRLVVIEIEPSEATLITGVVDVFDKDTGTFGFDPAAARVVGSSPVLSVNAGAPAANPVVPTGLAGRLPLAVVKLVAAQGSFSDAYASVLMCRPLLRADGGALVPSDYVRGGGISVGEESGGALINLTNCYISRTTCSLLGLEAEVAGLIQFATRGRTPDTTNVAGLLGTRQPVYAYAVPPPWRPTDYGTIAPREAWQRNPNAVPFASAQNIIGGSGSTFISLSAETPSSPGLTHRNAIVIWDNLAPYGAERGAGNAPIQIIDARGPHPEHAPGGAGTLPLEPPQDPAWGNDQPSTDSVYLGSVAALDLAADFMAQTTSGSRVLILDKVDSAGVFAGTRRPVAMFTTTSTTAIYPGHFPSMDAADDEVIPSYCDAIELYYSFTAGIGPGTANFFLFPSVGFGRPEIAGTPLSGTGRSVDTATAEDYLTSSNFSIKRDGSGSIQKALTVAAGSTSLFVELVGYVDPFIAAR